MSAQATRYLVVGGGMTGDAACKGIRDHDQDGAITLVGAEQHAPYKRPPLTKGLWSGGDEAKIWRGTEDAGVDVRLGRRIVSVDPAERLAVLTTFVFDPTNPDLTFSTADKAEAGVDVGTGGSVVSVVAFHDRITGGGGIRQETRPAR